MLDTLANALAARHSPQGQILRDWYGRRPSDAGRRAFLFGALAHILEMDDLHRESVTHPGCVVVPAAWAIAAQRGSGGRDFLKAVLAGYEAVCRVGNAVGRAHYQVWHNTATCGPYGAAIAAATLLELREEPTVWALGNAGTQSAGLVAIPRGRRDEQAPARGARRRGRRPRGRARGARLHGPGRRSSKARRGSSSRLAPTHSPSACSPRPTRRGSFGSRRSSLGRRAGTRTRPSRRRSSLHGRVEPDAIASVRIETYRAALALCDNAAPTSEYEAKFSLQHCAAAALSDGAVTLGSFDGPARARLALLASRTTAVATAAVRRRVSRPLGRARDAAQRRPARRSSPSGRRAKATPSIP